MSTRFILCVIVIFLHLVEIYAQRNGCSLTFPIKDDRNEPIILKHHGKKYDLFIPEEGKIHLKSGESVSLFCPYTRNVLKQSNNNFTEAICMNKETLKVHNIQYPFNQLQCSAPAKGSIAFTNTRCGNNRGKIINIGYKIPDNNNWITLIEVCYDSNEGNALYSQHVLYGEAIKYASSQKYRPSFQENGVIGNLTANSAYKQTNQKKVLVQLLGSESLANKYLNKTSFLTRGHLAPDADFLFAGLQFTTYFFINTCPQWEAVNGGNWLGVESMVRKVAESYQKPLRIITGSHGVLSLPDINNNLQNIFLDTRGILPVPKFLWKIIYLESTKEGIALVSLNDPFIKKISNEHILCPDVCNEYGWISKKWKNIAKGYMYCCDIRILQKTVKTIPSLNIRSILRKI
ncbi:hypothetical protein ILUMI_10778 [Ignelater luminosus]|uniref:DNA/RNA non-specific endonuclease domain-containing protein n=1 Tax=Ignelater luminosus TaxID=2038154 RepID=A0A8K0D2N0_IGNLU|nr:hypothetical protein ILUMI_10778 [Ignelater luminosus]